MCGIAGIVGGSATGTCIRELIEAMLKPLHRRGPEGQHVEHIGDAVFGHTHLAFRDLSAPAQPIVTDDGTAILCLSGEIYNVEELVAELTTSGLRLRTKNDAEALLHVLRRDGLDALSRLDGMFAIAFHDRMRGLTILARDRYGEKPLYWARNGTSGLAFASQLDAMAWAVPFRINPDALWSYLRFNAVCWPLSLVEGVFKVPPGGFVTRDRNSIVEGRYWSPHFGGMDATYGSEPTERQLACRLVAAVDKRIKSSQAPLGLFLSGGLDSALVAAAAKSSGHQPIAFTLGFHSASFDESEEAAFAAREIGLPHRIVTVGAHELARAALTASDNVDEPIADPSMLPTTLLVEAARCEVKGVLGGDGADDLFAGYPFFRTLGFYRLADRLGAAPFRRIASLLPAGSTNMHMGLILRQLCRGVGEPDHRRFASVYGAFDEHDLSEILVPQYRSTVPPSNVNAPWPGASYDPGDRVQCIQIGMLRRFLCDVILTKLDRSAMLHGFEIRSPFLSNEISSIAFKLPCHAKYDRGRTKLILHRTAQVLLPKSLWTRRKRGFRAPLASLIRGSLRSDIRGTLLDASDRTRLFRPRQCQTILDAHDRGEADNQKQIWAMFTVQRWIDRMATASVKA